MARNGIAIGVGAGVGIGLLGYGLHRYLAKRQETAAILRSFAERAHDLQITFAHALTGGSHELPMLDPDLCADAKADSLAFLRSVATQIRQKIEYVTDERSHGVADYWQSPDETRESGRGDCEDQGLLALDVAYRAGIYKAQLAVGTYDGRGHAWVEFAGTTFVLDPTAGLLVPQRPSAYKPAVWLTPMGPVVRKGLVAG